MIQIMHGDCLEKLKELPDGSIDLILTDPPYGTTICKWDEIIPFDLMWEQLKRVIKSNGAIVLFGTQPFTPQLIVSNLDMFRYCWYWRKSKGSNFFHLKNMPAKTVEDIMVFSHSKIGHECQLGDKRMVYNPQGIRKSKTTIGQKRNIQKDEHRYNRQNMSDLYQYQNEGYPNVLLEFKSESGLHPTQKPVALMEYLIKTYTNENETVLDFTMGSGSTGVAAVNTKRNFIGIELEERYFKIAEERINKAITDQASTLDNFL